MATLEAWSLLTHETILFQDALSLSRSGRHRQNGGRLQIGMASAIRSERRAASDRNRWADYVGIRTKIVRRMYRLTVGGSVSIIMHIRHTSHDARFL
jgi:hypothetical protein